MGGLATPHLIHGESQTPQARTISIEVAEPATPIHPGLSDFPHVRLRHVRLETSRSEQRPSLPQTATAAPTPTTTYPTGSTRAIGHAMVVRQGWPEVEWSCLDALWTRESSWNVYASNSESGAYGIPQSLPGEKMSQFGSDWRTNPVTQIEWGLWYIRATYGSACGALVHENSFGWY